MCNTCRSSIASTCKNTKEGVCGECSKVSESPAATVSCKRPSYDNDDAEYSTLDESSTTAEESSSQSTFVASVERKVRRQMDTMASQFIAALQEQNRKMEENCRMLLEYIKSIEVSYMIVLLALVSFC